MKIFIISPLFLFIGSCCNNNSTNYLGKTKGSSVIELTETDSLSSSLLTKNHFQITLNKLVSDSGNYIFNSEGVQLFFDRGEVVFSFTPACNYRYPIKIIKQKIIFFWEYRMNCTFDRGLYIKYPKIKNPRVGEKFGSIEIIGEKLVVQYYFQDWVNNVNRYNQDVVKLFPKEFTVKYFIPQRFNKKTN
jgi:hypothetical protein